ncbi:MAG: hypothetical protein EPO11_09455 [Gammaproteobacteria bacterium]|nr:MAG: hypothetical protein EPO11_09455 [Gammaproteobacteria bacterium]
MFRVNNTTYSKNFLFQPTKNKLRIAIISAMPEELKFFYDKFSELKATNIKLGQFDSAVYEYKEADILITHVGLGTTFTAAVLTLIHAHFKPEYVLLSGTAGGINAKLNLRDVVIAENAFEAEIQDIFTELKGTPFESCLKHPLKNENFPHVYSANEELLEMINSLQIEGITIHKGTVVSSNTFPAPKELFEKIKSKNPYSIDMETSALYQTAWLLDAKVLAVRGISNVLKSDGTDDQLHLSDVTGSAHAAAKVLFVILDNILQMKHTLKKSQAALTHEATKLIKKYNLQQHPEGGYFSATYKSTDEITSTDPNRYNNEKRSAGTSIYYLLDKSDYSAWHSLKSDETWHFYYGSPIYVYIIDKSGELKTHLLGNSFMTEGASFQVHIQAGDWFAAENVDKATCSFVGCTVSPGFEYHDFILANRSDLTEKFPQHREIIEKLTRDFDLSNRNLQVVRC